MFSATTGRILCSAKHIDWVGFIFSVFKDYIKLKACFTYSLDAYNQVESLLAKVSEIENQIQKRKTLAEKLAFGIIKEKLKG